MRCSTFATFFVKPLNGVSEQIITHDNTKTAIHQIEKPHFAKDIISITKFCCQEKALKTRPFIVSPSVVLCIKVLYLSGELLQQNSVSPEGLLSGLNQSKSDLNVTSLQVLLVPHVATHS